ncbi:MAG: undecaprenyldiphospho-muramoylpentapeptide beta-N-acetylglucosaminyltransferase [Deltaproteobacteria bacterium]|nr:undecaprenyldiphospho-muramoylpentapeptide beta-N-acetylglucosaminyltransferase [Deltaproteobacteria bacterium]
MKLIMAGGGTGGHLFPALALAEEFRARDAGIGITFIGAKGGIEEKAVPKRGYPLMLLNIEGIKRVRGLRRAAAVWKAFISTIRAFWILRSLRPEGVIGSGSYSSAPVVIAAWLLGIKTAILEQNALPGLTNKALGRLADRVYVSFAEARGYFPARRTVLAGNPVRKEILRRRAEKTFRRGERFTILVFGGSQGATALNAAFLDAAEYLSDIWPGLRVIHQTGEEGFLAARASYGRKELKAEVFKFIDDMADMYLAADLCVCRAGATSIAEITATGIPSILIPYPFAADNHQEVNARSLENAGASVMIRQERLTGRSLADAIRRLYEKPQELKTMSGKARALGRREAASVIAEDFLRLISGKNIGKE